MTITKEQLAVMLEARKQRRTPVKRVSLRKAINEKCIDCSAGSKHEVRHCTARHCPLWPARPYQQAEG